MIKLFRAESSVQEKLGRILVMNDAAHSLGARYSSRQRTGCETDIAIFSLHAVKNVTTAEGGAICLNLPNPFDNAELYKENGSSILTIMLFRLVTGLLFHLLWMEKKKVLIIFMLYALKVLPKNNATG